MPDNHCCCEADPCEAVSAALSTKKSFDVTMSGWGPPVFAGQASPPGCEMFNQPQSATDGGAFTCDCDGGSKIGYSGFGFTVQSLTHPNGVPCIGCWAFGFEFNCVDVNGIASLGLKVIQKNGGGGWQGVFPLTGSDPSGTYVLPQFAGVGATGNDISCGCPQTELNGGQSPACTCTVVV